jgi:hypothetical protein
MTENSVKYTISATTEKSRLTLRNTVFTDLKQAHKHSWTHYVQK